MEFHLIQAIVQFRAIFSYTNYQLLLSSVCFAFPLARYWPQSSFLGLLNLGDGTCTWAPADRTEQRSRGTACYDGIRTCSVRSDALVFSSVLVTSSKALVTTSDALVSNSFF